MGFWSFYARNNPYTYYYEGNYRELGGEEAPFAGGDPPQMIRADGVSAEPVNHHKGT